MPSRQMRLHSGRSRSVPGRNEIAGDGTGA